MLCVIRCASDVVFVPPPPKVTKTPVVFAEENGTRGIKPIGLEKFLTACALNNSSLWCASQALFRNGVLVPRSKLSTAVVEQRIRAMSHLYPVNDKICSFGAAMHERDMNLRGFHALGDDESIARLWASLFLLDDNVKGWDVSKRAMCWTPAVPGTVFVPYLDLDEQGLELEFDRVWTTRVSPTIKIIQRELEAIAPGQTPVIFFNYRPVGELFKYSFHVHWPTLGVENIMQWKEFLAEIPDMPKKLVWKQTGNGWEVKEDDKIPIFDRAVYSGRRQLFRGPFCGKNEDANAVMVPCFMQQVNGKWEPHKKTFDHTAIVKAILNARIAKWPTGLIMLNFLQGSQAPPAFPVGRAPPAPAESAQPATPAPLTDFIMPFLIAKVLPQWQQRRHKDMLGMRARGAVVPVENLRLSNNEAGRGIGIRFLRIEGDTFCETDEKHVHTKNQHAVGIKIDLSKCTIAQTCFACGQGAVSQIYCFLHTGNRIDIVKEEAAKFTAISFWAPSKNSYQLLLDYFADQFLLQRALRTVWVYDKASCVWRTDVGGNMVVGGMIDELNERHVRYLKAYKDLVIEKQIRARNRSRPEDSVEGAEEFLLKVHGEARKFMMKNTPFVNMNPTARGRVIEDLRSYNVHQEAREMNKSPHLIPMKNKKYVNVFTGEMGDMGPEHLFTSCVNAEMINDTEEMSIIDRLFEEISTGDHEKMIYLKRISAYCLTFLVHDRKFYVLWGVGHNGKGMLKEFIMELSKGPEGFDSRAKNLLQSFWSFRGNSQQGSENASPESHELQNKSFLYTDDISPVPLDTNKLKRVVGAEEQSGRGLYGKPVDIKPRGKVMWTTNFPPLGPGEDNAYWERCILVKMRTKYVPLSLGVDPKKYRFEKNHARYLSLLEYKDAFFTVCVQELVKYYQSLAWDPVKRQPAVLGSFPLPPSVEVTMAEARAEQLPLACFLRDYTVAEKEPLRCVRVEELFKNYIFYLENINDLKTRRSTTQGNFVQLLATALDRCVTHGIVECVRLVKQVVPVMKSYNNPLGSNPVARDEHEGEAGAGAGGGYVEGSYLDRALAPTGSGVP